MCAQPPSAPTAPTALTALTAPTALSASSTPTALSASPSHTLRRHHLCHCPHLAALTALGSGFQVF